MDPFVDRLAAMLEEDMNEWLFGVLGVSVGGGILSAIITATIGAVVLLFILSLFKKAA